MDNNDLKKWLTEQISYLERTKSEPDKFAWDPEYDFQLAAFRLALERLEPVGPLTLDQLREMDGKPVWVKCLNSKKYTDPPIGWRIMERSITGTIGVWNGESCFAERDYGVDWLAYAYPPAHIDREAWEPCELCEKQRKVFNEDFCGNCGRPLTQEAWAELEKRLRG